MAIKYHLPYFFCRIYTYVTCISFSNIYVHVITEHELPPDSKTISFATKNEEEKCQPCKKKTITLLREPTDLVLLKHEQDCSNNKTVLKIDSDRTIQSPGISIVLNNIMLDPC